MTEHSPPGSAPIVVSISTDMPLRILRTRNGFVIDVGEGAAKIIPRYPSDRRLGGDRAGTANSQPR